MHPLGLAALLGHRSQARESLDLFGAVAAVTVRTEGGGQTRGQGLARTGQAVKEVVIRVLGKESLQLRVEPGDHRHHRAQLLGQPLRHQGRSLHQDLVPSQRLGWVDLAEQILGLLGRKPRWRW